MFRIYVKSISCLQKGHSCECCENKTHTVNMVILSWGKISRKCWQDISRWGIIHDTTPISFIKANGFRIWGKFREEDKSANNAKINPVQKFPRLQ